MPAKKMSAIALVCGICGVVGSFFPVSFLVIFITISVSILGAVFGAKGMKAAKLANEPTMLILAIAGLVLGIIGIVFAGTEAFVCATCLCSTGTPYVFTKRIGIV